MSAFPHTAGDITNPWKILGLGFVAVVVAAAILLTGKLALYLVIGAVLFGLFTRFPVLGLYATTLLLLLSGSRGILGTVEEGALAVTLARLCGTAALAAWAINVLARKVPFEFNWPVVWLSVFCVWALFSTLLAHNSGELFPEWIRLVTLLGFFLLAVNTLNSTRNLHTFLVILMISGLLMSLMAVLQVLLPSMQVAEAWRTLGSADVAFIDQESLQGEAAVRASGTAGHSNWLAMALLLILPLNAYWWGVSKTARLKVFIAAMTGIEVVALVLTYTRTGLVIGVVLAALLLLKRLVRMSALRIFAFLFACVVAWVLLPQPYKERVLNPRQYTQSRSVQSRLELQEAAARYAVQNPVFGLGPGGFGTEFVRENSRTAATMRLFVNKLGWQAIFIGTHNMYLQVASDMGLVGLFFFLAFYLTLLRKTHLAEQRYRKEGDEWGVMLTSSLFVSLIGFALCAVFLHALTQKIWWMLAAAAVVVPLYDLRFKEGLLPGWSWTTQPRRRHG